MVQIIAHRGGRSLGPENTLAAAWAGYQTGAHSWEADVSFTRDQELILFHDADLIRCTNANTILEPAPDGGYPLTWFNLKQLQLLDAGINFIPDYPLSIIPGKINTNSYTTYTNRLEKFKTAKIPTLTEAIEFTRSLNWKVNIELKDYENEPYPLFLVRKSLDILEWSGIAKNNVVISSFNHNWLNWILELNLGIEIQALVHNFHETHFDYRKLSFSTYNLNVNLIDSSTIIRLKEKGKKINLFTINDPKIAEKFLNICDIDGIITDFPQEMMKFVQ